MDEKTKEVYEQARGKVREFDSRLQEIHYEIANYCCHDCPLFGTEACENCPLDKLYRRLGRLWWGRKA